MKNKILLLGLVLLSASVMLSSCATILGGAKKGVRVKGEPKNAQVYYNGSFVGNSPVTVQVPKSAKKGNSKVTVKADNYNPTEISLTRSWSIGYTILDIAFGLWPLVIDGLTGNIYQPKPGKIVFLLEPTSQPFKVGDKVSFVFEKDLTNITGEITSVSQMKATVKYTRPANLIEKQTKKVEQITEEKEFYFNEIKKVQ